MAKFFRNHAHWGAFLAEVEDGRVVGVRPFERDSEPSPMIEAVPSAVHSPLRVSQPFVREGWLRRRPPQGNGDGRGREAFVPVPWENALDLVAGELLRVKDQHGHAAIMAGSQGWGSAGIFHEARGQLRRFMGAFGGFVDQTSNYSFGTALVFLPHVVGSVQPVTGPLTSWSSIARHAKLMVLFGGANPKNMQVTKGGCGSHATGQELAALARAGVAVVSVSPIRDDGPPALAPQWIAIRPGTDTALLLALAHTLIAQGLHDEAFLARYCSGFEHVRAYLFGARDGTAKDADWAASITGIDAASIRSLATRMAACRTMISASWSLQRADHGEQPYWAVILLACCLGQIGLPGGGFGFGYGSATGIAEPPPAFRAPTMEGAPNPLGRAIPAARIADCLLHPGGRYDFNGRSDNYPDIKLVYWAGGNPFHHHQDINRLRAAWRRPQTVIVNEPWWTASARHADIVLPATTTLERDDIGCAPRDRFVFAMHRAIAPVGQARDDFAIFRALSRRLGCEGAYTQGRDARQWLAYLYGRWRENVRSNRAAIPDFERFWQDGFFEIPSSGVDEYVMLAAFRADPATNKLATPSGRIELFSERLAGFGYADCPPHPSWIEPSEWGGAPAPTRYRIHLISSQPRHKLHSQMDAGPVSARGKVAGREAVELHPDDARRRGIKQGDIVRVYNERGACLAGAAISDLLTPGVARLACGAWYDPAGEDGTLCAHGNANMLTHDRGTSQLSQGPASGTNMVEIELWRGPLPPVRAFTPPEIAPGPDSAPAQKTA